MAFLFAVFFLIPIMLAFAGFIFSFFILDFGIDGIFSIISEEGIQR